MVIITQIQPYGQPVNLEKNYVKIILENYANISGVQFVNGNNKIFINNIFNNANLCMAEITKYLDIGKYLVSVLYNDEFSNELEYICYPEVDPLQNSSIAFSTNKVKINGYGFNDKTIVIAKFDDNIKNIHYDFINENELVCHIEKYDCISNAIALFFEVNNITSPSVIHLKYEKPVITGIYSSIFINHCSQIIIHGKYYGI